MKVKFSKPYSLLTDYGPINFGGVAVSFQVIDWDLDGKKDLLIGGCSGKVWFFRNIDNSNKANPKFAEGKEIVKVPSYVSIPLVIDWDRNGIRDLLVAGRDSFIYYFKNKGSNKYPKFEFEGPIRDKEGIIFSFEFSHPHYSLNSLHGYIDTRFFNYLSPVVCDWNSDGGNDLLVGDQSGIIFFLEDLSQGKGVPVFKGLHYKKKKCFSKHNYIEKYGEKFARPTNILTYEDGTIIRLGKGSECSPSRGEIGINGWMAKPQVVDWDDDGDKDLLVASGHFKGHIDFIENVNPNHGGTPQLVYHGPVLANGRPIELDFHDHFIMYDWDEDGYKDLIVSHSNFIYFYKNTRKKKGIPELTLIGALSRKNAKLTGNEIIPCIIDWDSDGLNDFIEGSWEGYVSFRKNIGTKDNPRYSFEAVPLLDKDGPIRIKGETDPDWGEKAGVSKPFVCDWNGDGILDLIVGSDTGHVYYYQGVGKREGEKFPRTFINRGRLKDKTGKEIKVHNRSCPVVFDYNGDGRLDLLVSGATYQMGFETDPHPGVDIQYFENIDDNEKGEPILAPGKIIYVDGKPFTFDPNLDLGTRLSAGDIDNDGKIELIFYTDILGTRIIKNIGSFEEPQWTLGQELPGGNYFGYLAGDINGDGKIDAVIGSGEHNEGCYRLNLGSE